VFADTPAAAADLQEGDIILAVDGDVVDQERTLPDRLYAYEPGDTVTLTVLRDGEEMEVEVTLGGVMFEQGRFGVGPGMGMGPGGRRPGRGQGFGFGPGSPMMPGYGPHFDEFFEAHPFMGRMFEYFGPGMRFHHPHFNEFFEAHPFMGKMFEHFGPGGMFRFGPEGFEFAPDAGDAPTAPEAPPAQPGSAA
jgi:membrane-associated protease RseP (regulator of RpoE activity)